MLKLFIIIIIIKTSGSSSILKQYNRLHRVEKCTEMVLV